MTLVNVFKLSTIFARSL